MRPPYPKPAPTVIDDGVAAAHGAANPPPSSASPAVAQLLARSSGMPLVIRAIADALRVAASSVIAIVGWPMIGSRIDASISAIVPPSVRPVILAVIAAALGFVATLLLFRITSRKFARPLRGRR